MKNLLFKRRRGAGSALVLILTWLALVLWIYLYYPEQQPKYADVEIQIAAEIQTADVEPQTADVEAASSTMIDAVADQVSAIGEKAAEIKEQVEHIFNDESAFDEFVFVTVPQNLNRFILKPFIGLLGFALGGAFSLPFIPDAMKEHFTASPRRVVSFFFLIFIVLNVIKFLVSMLGLKNITEKIKNFLESKVSRLFAADLNKSFYDSGYQEGYTRGYEEAKAGSWKAKELEKQWYERQNKNPLFPKLKRIFNYVLFFILLLEIMLAMSSDLDFQFTDFDSLQPDNITINNHAAVSSDISN